MQLNNDWKTYLQDEFTKSYYGDLTKFIDAEYTTYTIFPAYNNIFRAFNLLPLNNLKVVILGQDPYHGANQANGLAFSVCDECKIPPSLRNIYKELIDDLGCPQPKNGNLTQWASEGVLLINSVLTVIEANANSHKNMGWETFTDNLIQKLSSDFENLVFILWGAPSQKKEKLIDTSKHLIIKSAHPSPLSAYRGFFGSHPFSRTNEYLKMHHKKEINWCLSGQQTLL